MASSASTLEPLQQLAALWQELPVLRDRDERIANRLDEDRAEFHRFREEVMNRFTVLEAAIAAAAANQGRTDASGKLEHRNAQNFTPNDWSGDGKARPFQDFSFEVANYVSVLEPLGKSATILAWAAGRDAPITSQDVQDLQDFDDKYTRAVKVDSALGHLLAKITTGEAKTMVRKVDPERGLRAWQVLAEWYRPQCRRRGHLHDPHHELGHLP